MLAYVGLSCGQCGPILWLYWPMLASCWPMLSQKIRKMGTAKKHCKTHDILMVGGLSWGYVGPSSIVCVSFQVDRRWQSQRHHCAAMCCLGTFGGDGRFPAGMRWQRFSCFFERGRCAAGTCHSCKIHQDQVSFMTKPSWLLIFNTYIDSYIYWYGFLFKVIPSPCCKHFGSITWAAADSNE